MSAGYLKMEVEPVPKHIEYHVYLGQHNCGVMYGANGVWFSVHQDSLTI
jgi:hypothetical protein